MSTDAISQPLPTPGLTAPSPHKRRRAPAVFAALILLAGAVAGFVYWRGLGTETTDNAQVEGHVATVASRVAGKVARVLVTDNQLVAAGDILVELDDRNQQVKLTAARADLAAAQAALDAARAQLALTEKHVASNLAIARGGVSQAAAVTGSTRATIDQAAADVGAARSRLKLAELDYRRSEKLVIDGAVARAELDSRSTALEQAEAQVAQAEARLVSARASLSNSAGTVEAARGRLMAAGSGPEQVDAARAQIAVAESRVAQAQAAVDQAVLDLEYTQIRAEQGGVIARRTVEPGAMVSPDRPLMAVVSLDDTWVVANFKEDQLAELRPGQAARIAIDTYDVELAGHVESVAPGTGSRFSLLPPENASGNFTKVVQRVPVLIRIDQRDGLVLRPGMSAEVTVVVE